MNVLPVFGHINGNGTQGMLSVGSALTASTDTGRSDRVDTEFVPTQEVVVFSNEAATAQVLAGTMMTSYQPVAYAP